MHGVSPSGPHDVVMKDAIGWGSCSCCNSVPTSLNCSSVSRLPDSLLRSLKRQGCHSDWEHPVLRRPRIGIAGTAQVNPAMLMVLVPRVPLTSEYFLVACVGTL